MRSNSLALSFAVLLAGCMSPQKVPEWSGPIWIGNPTNGTIERTQDGQSISCTDPKFRKYYAMDRETLTKLFETYAVGCREWKEGATMKKPDEAWQPEPTPKAK